MRFDRKASRRRLRGSRLLPVVTALVMAASACGTGSDGEREAPTEGGDPPASAAPSPRPSWNTAPSSIAALGDSISTGFHACEPLSDCPESSWATGTDPAVNSLASRLLEQPSGNTHNHAVSGAVAADLPAQASEAVADKPELVTIMIGANDACASTPEGMTSVDKFQEHLDTAVRTLRDASPNTQILMVSVPDVLRMFDVGKTHQAARDVWQLGICQALLRAPLSTSTVDQDRRKRVDQRVTEYNTVLREVCESDERCRYDGGVVHRYSFTQAELSQWDWFHPSKRGQKVLARVLHRTVAARG